MTQFQTYVLARPEAMSGLTDKVMAFLSVNGVDPRASHHVALVFEEILTNLATHGDCRDVPATIAVKVLPDRVTGEIIDRGPAFDPRLAPPLPVDVPAADRPVGGLGLHLVRQLTSHLQYARQNDQNLLTFDVNRG
jgi:serine/threonine-protein kinase RsbW